MWAGEVGDEELRPICVFALVGHGDHPPRVVLPGPVELIREILAPNTLPPPPGPRRVAPLKHEAFDVAVEDGSVIVPACGEFCHVPYGFGGVFGVELDCQGAVRGAEAEVAGGFYEARAEEVFFLGEGREGGGCLGG